MPSPEHEAVVAMMDGGLGLEELPIDEQRVMMESSAELFAPGPDVACSEVEVGGILADWVSTSGSGPDRAILYLHGGAYVMGSRHTHRGLAGRIAHAADARVLLPEYRLAPEHPFPAAVQDARACWRWMLSQGLHPAQMAIAGDSAGGGLALATLLALKEAGDPLPGCAVALSPWTDLQGTGHTAVPGIVDDPMLTRRGLRDSAALYAGDQVTHPLASPLLGELAGLPPMLLQVGSREILLADSTRFAERAHAAGVPVTLEVEEGLIHVWQMFPHLPESAAAVARIGAFITQHCPGGPSVCNIGPLPE